MVAVPMEDSTAPTKKPQPTSHAKSRPSSASSSTAPAVNAWTQKRTFRVAMEKVQNQAPVSAPPPAAKTQPTFPPTTAGLRGKPVRMQQPPAVATNVTIPFGTVGQESPSSANRTSVSYASVIGKTTPTAEKKSPVSGAFPKEIQQNIQDAKLSGGPIQFGTLDAPSPDKVSLGQSVAVRNPKVAAQFNNVQRVQSAPAPVAKDPHQASQTPLQAAQDAQVKPVPNAQPPLQSIPDEAAAPPSMTGSLVSNSSAKPRPPMMGYPYSFNPAASSYAPFQFQQAGGYGAYAPPPQMGQMPGMPQFYQGMPPAQFLNPMSGQPMPKPPVTSTSSIPVQAALPPTSSALQSAASSAPPTPALVPKPRSSVKIVIKNPDTMEEVKLPVKEVKKEETPKKKEKSEEKEKDHSPARSPSPAAPPKEPTAVAVLHSVEDKVDSSVKTRSRSQSPSKHRETSATERSSSAEPSNPAETEPEVPVEAQEDEEVMEEGEISPELTVPTLDTPIYSRSFLMSFKDFCLERPSDLKVMEAIIGGDVGGGSASARRKSSRGGDRHSSDGGRSRFAELIPQSRPAAQVASRSSAPRGPPPGFGSTRAAPPPGLAPQRSSGGRRSARGSRSGYHAEKEVVNETPVQPLVKSENRWKSKFEANKGDLDDLEIYKNKIRSMLNKLTVENFESLSGKMVAMGVKKEEELFSLVELIFLKAIEEQKFAGVYAKLCFEVSRKLQDFPEEYKATLVEQCGSEISSVAVIFRKVLLSTCQKKFLTKAEWSQEEAKHLNDQMTEVEVKEYMEEESQRRKTKIQALGNIKFIGELFNLGLINKKIMHECIKNLLRDVTNPEEEEIECLCDLIVTVGEKLDEPEAKNYMTEYFARLLILSTHKGLSSRVRFKLLDVIDLRKRDWKERERQLIMNAGPMKIKDVHRASEESQRAESRRASARIISRDSGISRGSRRPSSERISSRKERERHSAEWSVAGGNTSRRSTRGDEADLSSRPKRAIGVDSNNVVLGPGSKDDLGMGARGWNSAKKDEGASAGGKTTAASETAKLTRKESNESVDKTSGNMFDALAEDVHQEDKKSDESDTETDDVFIDLPKNVLEKTEFEKYLQKKFSNELLEACDDSVASALRVLAELRSYVEDDDVEERTLEALKLIISEASPDGLKYFTTEKSKERILRLADFFGSVYSFHLVSTEELVSLLLTHVGAMIDLILDNPGCDIVLGAISSSLVLAGVITVEELKGCILTMAEDFGDFTPRVVKKPGFNRPPTPPCTANFFVTMMDGIRSLEGEIAVREYFAMSLVKDGESKGDALLQLLDETDAWTFKFPWWGTDKEKLAAIEDDVVAGWLKTNKLLSLIAPKLQLRHELGALLQPEIEGEEEVPTETVISFIETNVNESKQTEERFISTVTDVLLHHGRRYACSKAGQDVPKQQAEEKRILEKWFSKILKPFLQADSLEPDTKQRLQMEVLWTVQALGNTEPFKSDDQFFRRIFDLVYDTDVVDEKVFGQWEQDETRQSDTKEVTMVRGARDFLSWLRTAEEA